MRLSQGGYGVKETMESGKIWKQIVSSISELSIGVIACQRRACATMSTKPPENMRT